MKGILFRGKGLIRPGHYRSGRWTTGYYVKFTYESGEEEHQIINPFYGVNGVYMAKCVVDPETISQYTGFVDKYGNKIFEGDILKSTYPDEPYEDVVAYEEVFWKNGWYQADFGDRERSDDLMQNFLSRYSEVVGNIWDNPELLEAK